MELLKEVLKQIKPTPEEEKKVMSAVDSFLKKLNPALNDAKAVLGGSGAKGTWLSGSHDVDIYVLFNYEKYKEDKLSDILEKKLKAAFKDVMRLHGSRDYFQVKQGKYIFEIVPILRITSPEKALNITDISPMHTKWVKKYSKFADQIRLTKQFMKASNTYGAESYIRGFSGYEAEVLTIHYKGFLELIRAASKWKEKTILDPEHHYKNKEEILRNINISKLVSPLVVIDPVDKNRNIAAALSQEKYKQFIRTCKLFLSNPSEELFKIKKMTAEDFKKKAKNNKLILLEVISLKGKEDIIGCKLLKAFNYIAKQLQIADFKLLHKSWTWDKQKKALFAYILDPKPLEKYKKWPGPPMQAVHHVMQFKKVHKDDKIIQQKNRLYAIVKRKFTVPEQFIKKLIKDPYIKEKVKEIKPI